VWTIIAIAARLEHVVHGLGDAGLVRPVEGLPERDQAVRPGRRLGKLLCAGANPAHVREAARVGGATALGEHRRVGVEADRLLEQMREPDRGDAGAAAAVEEPPAPVEPELLGEHGLEPRRVGRPTGPVVGGGARVDRGVVRHAG
jgi:hypothetical protein